MQCTGLNFFYMLTIPLWKNRSGNGNLSASGGNGFAGGGGGRVSVNVFSRHDDPKFLVHGKTSWTKFSSMILIWGCYYKPVQ